MGLRETGSGGLPGTMQSAGRRQVAVAIPAGGILVRWEDDRQFWESGQPLSLPVPDL